MTLRETILFYFIYGIQMSETSLTLKECYQNGYDYGMRAPGVRYYKVNVMGYSPEQNAEFNRGMKAAHAAIDCRNNDKHKRDSEDFPR